jgi:hypothetical protein
MAINFQVDYTKTSIYSRLTIIDLQFKAAQNTRLENQD